MMNADTDLYGGNPFAAPGEQQRRQKQQEHQSRVEDATHAHQLRANSLPPTPSSSATQKPPSTADSDDQISSDGSRGGELAGTGALAGAGMAVSLGTNPMKPVWASDKDFPECSRKCALPPQPLAPL